jgi:type I restriction enzyme, S subunit
MIAKQLKRSILQAAVQGKLTKQLPEDGDARDLLREIQKEKARLIREGKIEKEKLLPEITEDEIPFDIPDNWCWVRLGEISHNHGQKKPDKEFTYIDISSINNESNILGDLKKIIKPENAPSRARKIVDKGDVIYATVRPYLHNICIIDREINPKPIVSTGFAVVCTTNPLLNIYLFNCFLSPMFDSYANDNDNSKGVAYPAINDDKFSKALIPLPPLTEQQRIVDRLEELLPEIDKLEKDESNLDVLQKAFPQKMKDSILQCAVQGKLTEQLESDSDARDLLKDIRKEKDQLIKQGKIKKENPLPEITDDEIPFGIPDNWCWVRLESITSFLGDGIHGTPNYTYSGEYYFVNGNNLKDGKIELKSDTKTVNKTEYIKYKKSLDETTVLVSINGTIGNVAFYNGEKIILGKSACYFNLLGNISKHYLKLLLNSDYFIKYVYDKATGSTIKNVSLKAMRYFPVPLPPLTEQSLIVERLTKLLLEVDKLEQLIQARSGAA